MRALVFAITAWRDSLPERQRKRLVHPFSVTRRFKASIAVRARKICDEMLPSPGGVLFHARNRYRRIKPRQ
jgi:hypothetical protein